MAARFQMSTPGTATRDGASQPLYWLGVDADADGDALFCTSMMTVEPFAALPDPGAWSKTVPLAYCAGPEPCRTLTANPAAVRIWAAVACESPITGGTGAIGVVGDAEEEPDRLGDGDGSWLCTGVVLAEDADPAWCAWQLGGWVVSAGAEIWNFCPAPRSTTANARTGAPLPDEPCRGRVPVSR